VLPGRADVVVVGAGHNGLVAATLLARAGLSVVVLERDGVVGGAARTERPFRKVPGLSQSTGSYLLGLMPPELDAMLDLRLPLVRRDPHYFLPTTSDRYLLMGSDREATRRQFEEFFTAADRDADDRLQVELDQLREDLAPAWLAPPLSVEDTADRYIRPALQATFVDLVTGSVADYLARFGFASELVVAMYAVTDGLSGLTAGPDTPGSGHNFLVHNMCRLPGADGTWMIVRGGMGTVTATLTDRATSAGAVVTTDAPVAAIDTRGHAVQGVVLADGREVETPVVVAACDPFTLAELAHLPQTLLDRLDGMRRPRDHEERDGKGRDQAPGHGVAFSTIRARWKPAWIAPVARDSAYLARATSRMTSSPRAPGVSFRNRGARSSRSAAAVPWHVA
jgi:phytoene dehydrogenase-like protein